MQDWDFKVCLSASPSLHFPSLLGSLFAKVEVVADQPQERATEKALRNAREESHLPYLVENSHHPDSK